MKVLHVHHALYLPIVYVRELRRRGVDARTLYFNTPDIQWVTGVPDYNFGPLSPRKPKNIPNIVRFIAFFLRKVSSFDIVHFHSSPGFL